MELYDVMRTTSAVREFTDDPLPDAVLRTILDNARFAPSGGNRQGTQVLVVRDPDARRQLAELTVPGARRYTAQKAAGEGPWNAVVPTRLSDEEIAATDVPDFWTTPVLEAAVVLVVVVDLRVVAAVDQDLDRVGIVGGASVYPLVWNILLAARHEGSAARSRPWPSRRSRGCASSSASPRSTPSPASCRWASRCAS